ncbi:MAG: tRNA preQ1(34) S-adenosylmethionine ribosyltransferase-isomerase QueA [Nitrospinota bacterium]|nr:MAG: tRNA preQ1(34) S-adenosylmethionine ribosyltransferase-isomerase QueA [Nitrospinota bacterium]
MDITLFDYELPPEAIAQHPLPERDQSRLLVLDRATGQRQHTHFYHLPDLLTERDFLVLNNTKVFPAKLTGYKAESGGRVELLLVRPLDEGRWEALLKPYARIREGQTLILAGGHLRATVGKKGGEGKGEVVFTETGERLWQQLFKYGEVPLPPYIHRPRGRLSSPVDQERYQTVYASIWGSVAAPTAGFHFSPRILRRLQEKGIETLFLTLHVGPGTFLPVRTTQVEEHKMEGERFTIPEETAKRIQQNRAAGKRLIAVGTTTTRALESAASEQGGIRAGEGWTDLFIYPGYRFKVVDALLTNFHLPRSTLLMLVSAFAGIQLIKETYQEAIARGYRFYSYGDAMLIL